MVAERLGEKKETEQTASSQLPLGFIPKNGLKVKGLKDYLMSNL